ncbi:MAG: carbon-nitrogen hydrolase family protein [Alphaproteobacteria bacterium]|nr:carbon-nitrogen hydrolase family protein [Rhodospirillales bacterium]MCW9045266.1 carbon-nitrogen hydrolase family protein [Alphaproteobacteria bacterium]
MAVVRASVVQAAPVPFDREKTLEKVRALAADAAKEGSKLVLFPEAFVSAYPKGLDFGARIGMRKAEGREDFRRYFDSSVDIPGPAVDHLGQTAAENNIFLVIGVLERDGGTLYCTTLTFAPDGTFLGKHRKLMPTALERLVWGFGDGSTLPVFDTEIGKIGSVICWENYMPALRLAMYNKGIQLYCAPTADDRPTWPSTMQHVAMEGRCFVLSCNQFTKRGDFPKNYDAIQGDDPEAIISNGGSCIVSPLGQFLADPVFGKEAILTADLDMDEIARGKYDFDATGHYARPDIFKLLVNEAPMQAVETMKSGFEE